jgi:hypothetical protein
MFKVLLVLVALFVMAAIGALYINAITEVNNLAYQAERPGMSL